MRTFSASFFLGVSILLLMPVLPSVVWLAGVGFTCLLMAMAGWLFRRKATLWAGLPLLVAGIGAGVLYAVLAAMQIQASWLPEAQEGQDLLLAGVIADVPELTDGGLRFLLDADGDAYQGRLRVAWYADDLPEIRAGERWQLLVRGKRPHGFANPGGFDYEQWLFAQRIGGTGYVRESAENLRLEAVAAFHPDNVRQSLRDAIRQALGDTPAAALVQGLAVAYRADISPQQWDVLRRTGTSHLLAISGLHIGLVAGFGFLPVWLLWRMFPGLYLRMPVRIAGGVAGAVLACLYALLAGFSIPTQRALVMVLVLLAGLLWRRQIPFSVTFALALLLVLLLDPLAPLSAGFWLSFAAVGLLAFLAGRRRRAGKAAFLWVQLALSVGMLPLTAGFFGSASLVSPLANLLAIPFVTLLVVPLVLLGVLFAGFMPWLAGGLWQLAAALLDWMMVVLGWLADFSVASVYLPLIPVVWLLLGVTGFILLWLPKGLPGRWLGAVLMLPMVFYQPAAPEPGAFRFSVLDVGQGLASVVQTAGHVLVFDTGPRVSDSFDAGELVLLPWLRGQGIAKIDRLMVSHADNDHSGGAQSLLAEMPTGDVWAGAADMLASYQPVLCRRGQHWWWDGVEFQVLHPAADFGDGQRNNRSCVLRVANAHHSVLLAADIERTAEYFLLKQQQQLESEVLLVPHHGSKTSSSPAFINAVQPELGIVTSGYRNRFHHPHPSVTKRYEQHEINLLGTVDSGELRLDFPADAGHFRVRKWREENSHFW
ncbi:MAG: DNA internalization-related competence protein ComEC/Rec2 [Gammaproteobacteria bacterium]|nr:DNA internalization-related competence protein ComEC/Rec2 [Gammaproteobacteria bacterium]MBU1724365.1 DNA internalization-related competence protein ComEC/Rec2 [Gammaproteobacteria bacterium]MBU2006023.1 DNA internalization-related competence protein ComEC/Rec2 [Gammaproteobacteria bacterium]